jgi:hypothetical protein
VDTEGDFYTVDEAAKVLKRTPGESGRRSATARSRPRALREELAPRASDDQGVKSTRSLEAHPPS